MPYLDPHALVPPHSPHQVLEFLALPQAVLSKLGGVGDLLRGRLEVLLLQLPGLAQDLLCGDLCSRQGLQYSTCNRFYYAISSMAVRANLLVGRLLVLDFRRPGQPNLRVPGGHARHRLHLGLSFASLRVLSCRNLKQRGKLWLAGPLQPKNI